MAEQANIQADDDLFVGSDRPLRFLIEDELGAAVNITGWALEWVLRRGPGEAALVTKTIGAGVSITNGGGGICLVDLVDTDTDDLRSGRYWHMLRRTDAGFEVPLSYGWVVLRAR